MLEKNDADKDGMKRGGREEFERREKRKEGKECQECKCVQERMVSMDIFFNRTTSSVMLNIQMLWCNCGGQSLVILRWCSNGQGGKQSPYNPV